MDQWPLWQRAVYINAVTAGGAYIGLASSGPKPSVNFQVDVVAFAALLMNLLFLVVRPRIQSQKNAGSPSPNVWRVLYQVLKERPYITALLVIQLLGTSQAAATTFTLIQTSTSSYVRGLPNAHATSLRLMGAAVILAGVAILWLLGAVGLWRNRLWAWWLVLVLNGLSATVCATLQLFKLNEFLLDPMAMAAVVLLLLRPVRTGFLASKTPERSPPQVSEHPLSSHNAQR